MAYASDITDAGWEKIKDLFSNGNRSVHDKRILVNAVFYITKTGCQWRLLPNDFPCWSTVHTFFYRAKKSGLWKKIMDLAVREDRIRMGKDPNPTYGLIDSQSTKTT
ncbi:MAG: Transposase, partial [candidate division TM6 bacterium GW2011_GWE2_41_16]